MSNNNLLFEDQSVWEYIRWYSYLSEQHKLLYISTPKVACTSLKWWFADLDGYSQLLSEVKDSNQPDPDLVVHDTFHKVAPSVTGLMPELLAPALVSENFFRFAVVRNPYKRIFSAWQSKLLLREPFTSDPYKQSDFFLMPIKNTEDIAQAFEGFLEHLATHEAPHYLDPHWTPQTSLLRPDLITYTNISHIEDTKVLKLELAKHLGAHFLDPFAQHRANESLIPYLPDFITKRAVDLIKSLYADDFRTFGYDDRLPDAKVEFPTSMMDIALQAVSMIRGRHQRLGEEFRQIAEKNQAITARDKQIVERENQVFHLTQTIVERNKQITSLTTQLNEIHKSKIWYLIQMYRKIRSRIHLPVKGQK